MRDNGMLHRFNEVIAAMGDVVRRGGFGTSVTPVSQFYFQQAFNNVIFGPWKRVADGYGKMVLGYFGRTPVPPDPEIVALAQSQLGLEPTTRDPREINDEDPTKGLGAARARLEAEGLPVTDENVFIVATCKDKGLQFLRGEGEVAVRKKTPEDAKPKTPSHTAADRLSVTVNGKAYDVRLEGSTAHINGRDYSFQVTDDSGSAVDDGAPTVGTTEVTAQLSGKILSVFVSKGDQVEKDSILVKMEALKMEFDVAAPAAGVVTDVLITSGSQVQAGDLLVMLG
jgi:pyruvate carboxylase subunit B